MFAVATWASPHASMVDALWLVAYTESSIRTVYLPRSVAGMLKEFRKNQMQTRKISPAYHDYNLVICWENGDPMERAPLAAGLDSLIKTYEFPRVTFHSFRHASITYKLKFSGGNVKAVQGDSGHADAKMVLNLNSHIMDEDRKKNAENMEESFYQKKTGHPAWDFAHEGHSQVKCMIIKKCTLGI